MTYKTTLVAAIRGSNDARVDGHKVHRLEVPDLPDTICIMDFIDEHGYEFEVWAVDQNIEFGENSEAVFHDTDGCGRGIVVDVSAVTGIDSLNLELGKADMSMGLSGDELYAGTWEWFDRGTSEFSGGFGTAQEAYVSAARHALEQKGIELKKLDEDGDLIG